MRHVESWDGAQALTFQIAEGADPAIGDGSDVDAIEAGILEWTTVPGAAAQVTVAPAPAGLQNAAALDRTNLVTFQDPDFSFPANVVAVTPTTSFTRRQAVDDEVVDELEVPVEEALHVEATGAVLTPGDTEQAEADEGARLSDERAEASADDEEAVAGIEDVVTSERRLDTPPR